MANEVQKIREEVERLQKRAEHNFGISLTENGRQFWLGESNVLTFIGEYIDTMQKEPVRIKKGCKYRCLSDMQNTDTGAISFFKDKIYSAPEDNTLVSEENGWLCDLSENSSNFELVEETVSKDLEEAAIQFATDTETGKVDVVKQSSFFWGAIYHKQQMMAKAVDAIAQPYNAELWLNSQNDLKELAEGEEVKVIVIKED